jgi:hypothetical protein
MGIEGYPYYDGPQMALTVDAAGIMRGEGLVVTEDAARLMRYKQSLDFYNGKHDVGRLGIGARVIVGNYGAAFVRKSASYLFPGPVVVGVDAADKSAAGQGAADRAQKALVDVALSNRLDLADLGTAIDAGVLGDGAYKITWDDQGERVRMVPVDPHTLSITTAGDDVRRVVHVCQSYDAEAATAGALYAVDLPAGQATVREEWTDTGYRVTVGTQIVHDGLNPYGWIPYVIFPNMPRPHQFWGESDLALIMDVNVALDRRLSILNHILELSGNPITVLEGVDGSQGVNVAPGALWTLPEGSRAYLLDLLQGGAIGQHLQFIEQLYRVLHDVSEMPRSSFGDAGATTSGVALEFVLQPLIQKTKRKRLIWTEVIERRSRMALRLLERFGGLDLGAYRVDDLIVRAIWPAMLPTDTHQVATDEAALYAAGIHSLSTAQRVTGIEDPEREQRAMQKERENGLHPVGFAEPVPQGAPGHGSDVPMAGQPHQ